MQNASASSFGEKGVLSVDFPISKYEKSDKITKFLKIDYWLFLLFHINNKTSKISL